MGRLGVVHPGLSEFLCEDEQRPRMTRITRIIPLCAGVGWANGSCRAIYLSMLPKEFHSCLFVQFVIQIRTPFAI